MTSPAKHPANQNQKLARPSAEEAKEAVRTLLRWAGDDPEREGLLDTPQRVIDAYEEYFAGYAENPDEVLARTFEEVAEYDEIVLLKNMTFESHCEHHIAPFIGHAHIAYLPDKKVVGISKFARLLDIYAKRLQTQEIMTTQIADAIERALKPKAVAVIIDAEHQCMTTRGVHKPGTSTVTSQMRGQFKTDPALRAELMRLISHSPA